MADIGEAFRTLKSLKNPFNNIDYWFTQRNLIEDIEYIDKNMNRQTKKIKVTHNFIALNMPNINNKSLYFDIEVFGDDGYHYKGTIKSHQGIIPGFIIEIKGDKKLFVHIDYNYNDENDNVVNRKFVNFIEVPKRFQFIEDKIEEEEIH